MREPVKKEILQENRVAGMSRREQTHRSRTEPMMKNLYLRISLSNKRLRKGTSCALKEKC
jgi:hypothetical protein